MNKTLRPEKYFVAYLDMLGSKEKIRDEKDGEWLNKINTLYQDAWKYSLNLQETYTHEKPIFKIFSDNIVIAEKVHDKSDDKDNSIFRLLTLLAYFQTHALIKFQWLVRGCVTMGELYIRDPCEGDPTSFIWGKALIQANYIEEQIAVFPRIIVDSSVLNLDDSIMLYYLCNSGRTYIKKDVDQLTYLNYLAINIELEHCGHANEILDRVRDVLTKMKSAYTDKEKILQKINWTEKYYQGIVEDNSRCIPGIRSLLRPGF